MTLPDPSSIPFRIEIYSWWRSGTGAGRSAYLDAICVRDADGLPYLPGRHVRGLMRDAVRCLGEWDAAYHGAEIDLFGEWGFRTAREAQANVDGDPVPYRGARRGALAFSDARMGEAERRLFAEDTKAVRDTARVPLSHDLFSVLRSTAMRNGVAAEHSLRAEEVAVPVTLYGTIDFMGFVKPEPERSWRSDWGQALVAAAPLIRSIGAKRQRGLGRAALLIGEDAP